MNLITKIRTAAFMQASLRAFFGNDFATFRWFDRQLKQGALAQGTCVVVTNISQVTTQLHPNENPLTFERVQFDCMDNDESTASDAADAIVAWLKTGAANFVVNGMFTSPTVNAAGPTNYRLNRRGGLYFRTNRPVPVETLDYRIMSTPI